MKLANQGNDLLWASILVHDLPKILSTYSIKSLGQVDTCEQDILILAFLLYLSGSKHHVDGPSLSPESILAFRQGSLIKM